MPQDTIICPNCGELIKISQVIAQDIETEIKHKYEKLLSNWQTTELEKVRLQSMQEAKQTSAKEIEELKRDLEGRDKDIREIKAQEAEFRKREAALEAEALKLTNRLEENDRAFKKKLEDERKAIKEEAKKTEQEAHKLEFEDLRCQLKEKAEKLEETQRKELDLRKKTRDLEDREKSLELEVTRKMDAERQQIEENTKRAIEESHKLKDMEKDKQLEGMKEQIEDLKRKAEQGSQKIQGEVMELELEKMLKDEFPFDVIEPVSSGFKGGDIIHTVNTQSGHDCGKILWESKRTKSWSEGWIQKVKDDQREAKADLAVIVSEVLPKGFHHFRQIELVWVADLPSALSLALALRTMLIQVAKTKELQTGKEEKKEIVYSYVTGPEFRNRVQAIMEAFIALNKDLDSERRAMENIWAKREKQIGRVVSNIAGMRGDLEGIVGPSLPSIKLLELPQPEE
jgi:hypothetical protein